MDYSIIKAVHIIFMVSYFAGLFYLVRLFVYYKDTDSFENPKKEILRNQYLFMMRRLWNIICIPAFCIMLIFGLIMIFLNPILLESSWFRVKIGLVFLLFYYHFWCWKMILKIRNLGAENLEYKNVFLRQMNEVSTYLLFSVVFCVILKQNFIDHFWKLFLGFVVLVAVILIIVKIVNRKKI